MSLSPRDLQEDWGYLIEQSDTIEFAQIVTHDSTNSIQPWPTTDILIGGHVNSDLSINDQFYGIVHSFQIFMDDTDDLPSGSELEAAVFDRGEWLTAASCDTLCSYLIESWDLTSTITSDYVYGFISGHYHLKNIESSYEQ